ncbi:RNA polymerase sigma factor [Flavivirga rizhaonensis]|nr:sigma factor [Flavivirga rizhaonensis]
MERVKRSDHKAYKLLYERLWESLYIKAFSMLGDKDLAKDVIQDIWISLWEGRSEIKNDNIEGYLMNAVRFKVYNEFRNLKYQNYLLS